MELFAMYHLELLGGKARYHGNECTLHSCIILRFIPVNMRNPKVYVSIGFPA